MAAHSEDRPAVSPHTTRRRLTAGRELLLALLPTLIVLSLLAFVESFSRQRVIFASLASSAFLIYLDPEHPANSVRSITFSHLIAALAGALANRVLGEGYDAAGAAMVTAIVGMIGVDAVHPPAVGTALTFAFRPADVTVLSLFVLCLAVIAVLVVLQNGLLRLARRLGRVR
jgi:CBS-domain-containing membrane protein